jgi:hypothetical protein
MMVLQILGVMVKNILDIRFDSIGTTTRPNNSLTIKANVSYDNKKLTDLNNDFIDSLTLFNSKEIVNRITIAYTVQYHLQLIKVKNN